MAFKLIVLSAILACANAGFLGEQQIVQSYGSPVAKVAAYSSAPSVSTVYQSTPVGSIQYAAAPTLVKSYQYAPSVISAPAIGSSAQSTIRSFDGTVSQYAKAVDTAFSSVRKQDTRITNNVYAPAAGPAIYGAKTLSYAAPTVYAQSSPVIATKSYQYSAPTVYAQHGPAVYAQHAPAAVYAHSSPVIAAKTLQYAAPSVYAQHGPAVYAQHAAPVVQKTSAISYSAAPIVAHVTFDGLGTHYDW